MPPGGGRRGEAGADAPLGDPQSWFQDGGARGQYDPDDVALLCRCPLDREADGSLPSPSASHNRARMQGTISEKPDQPDSFFRNLGSATAELTATMTATAATNG